MRATQIQKKQPDFSAPYARISRAALLKSPYHWGMDQSVIALWSWVDEQTAVTSLKSEICADFFGVAAAPLAIATNYSSDFVGWIKNSTIKEPISRQDQLALLGGNTGVFADSTLYLLARTGQDCPGFIQKLPVKIGAKHGAG